MEIVNAEIEKYCLAHTQKMPELFEKLALVTREKTTAPQMQVGPLEAKFLQTVVKMVRAKNILEIGTFTGYSSLAMALALPADGQIITCDIDAKTTAIAQEFWNQANVQEKIVSKIGPGLETLKSLPNDHFDLVFIDADKANYLNYFEASMPLLRKGGFFLVDNVLWSGRILNPQEESDKAIDKFNKFVTQDKRVEAIILPIRDGITLAQKL